MQLKKRNRKSHRKSHRNTRRRMGGDYRNLQLPPRPMSRVIQPNGPDFFLPEHDDFGTMRQHIIEHQELLPGLRQGLQDGSYFINQGPGVAVAWGQAPVGRVYHIISRRQYDAMIERIMQEYQRRAEQLRVLDEQRRVLDARRTTWVLQHMNFANQPLDSKNI